MAEAIPDKNLFMICRTLNREALRALPAGYHVRYCREDELELWKAMPFDDPETVASHSQYMSDYFDRVYALKGDLFFRSCRFVCTVDDTPIATAFIWKAYDAIQTLHWVKVRQEYEGKGIGRALLSLILDELPSAAYPIYLHTQPGSYRAIKLYSDFGFQLLSDPVIGGRNNELEESLPFLERHMPATDFQRLQMTTAPTKFLQCLAGVADAEF